MSWDDEDFEVPTVVPKAPTTDKWDGEDEGEDLKDNWFDEEEATDADGNIVKAVQVKKKKPIAERIAEKEKQKIEDADRKKLKLEAQKRASEPEAILEEKLRRQKLQEESDLQLAKEAFGIADEPATEGKIDGFIPTNEEEFQELVTLLSSKLTKYETSEHYSTFLESLFRNLAINTEAEDLKKLGTVLTSLGNEKSKAQKAKSKKKSKRANLQMGRENDYDDFTVGAEYEDFI